MRTCHVCHDDKPEGEFYSSDAYRCKSCRVLRQRELRAARRAGLPVRPRVGRPVTAVFPLAPLLRAMGFRPGADLEWQADAAAALRMTPDALSRAASSDRGSVTWQRADELAAAAGLHPGDVWPDLWWGRAV